MWSSVFVCLHCIVCLFCIFICLFCIFLFVCFVFMVDDTHRPTNFQFQRSKVTAVVHVLKLYTVIHFGLLNNLEQKIILHSFRSSHWICFSSQIAPGNKEKCSHTTLTCHPCWDTDGGTGTGSTNLFSLKNIQQKRVSLIKAFINFQDCAVLDSTFFYLLLD